MTRNADKLLTRYRALPYRRVVERIEDSPAEVYYVCRYPELPGLMADGLTALEAQRNGAAAFDDYIRAQLHWGLPIPEPEASALVAAVPATADDAGGVAGHG
jgi:predicted RNase H-like HicB family nuclease